MMKMLLTMAIGLFLFFGCGTVKSLRVSETVDRLCINRGVSVTHRKIFNIVNSYVNDKQKYLDNLRKKYDVLKRPGSNDYYFKDNKISNSRYEIAYALESPLLGKVYGILVDIRRGTGKCKSKVKIKYMNSNWKHLNVELARKIYSIK